jgi:pyruvate/2-oxoglutarate/acetoin dehydrogenase E1 component
MSPESTTSLSYIRAVNEALRWALAEMPEVILYGEDVAIPGGPFGASKGLYDEFGDRVFDTPISESAMIGTALGAALGGMRPVVEVMYGDFLMVAMDQIVNQVANTHYVSNGRQRASLTIRTQHGSTPGACAQHSQSLEAFFAHVPGLRVALPGTADDAYQLLRTAIASDDPVMVMESRRLYPSKGDVRLGAAVEPLGGARVRRAGRDATVVSWGPMLTASLAAADELTGEGIDVEVVDLRWAAPLDIDTILESAARTQVLAVAHEANISGGLGGEIVASAAERLGPAVRRYGRVGLPDLRMPAAPTLSAAVIPDVTKVASLIRRLVTDQNAPSIHEGAHLNAM